MAVKDVFDVYDGTVSGLDQMIDLPDLSRYSEATVYVCVENPNDSTTTKVYLHEVFPSHNDISDVVDIFTVENTEKDTKRWNITSPLGNSYRLGVNAPSEGIRLVVSVLAVI